MRVKFTPYVPPKGGKKYLNWQMKCNRCRTPCMKTKGATVANTRLYGEVEPLLILHAWVNMEWHPTAKIKTHRPNEPTRAQVEAVAAEHLEAWKEVYNRVT